MNKPEIDQTIKAGKIAAQVKKYARTIIKKDIPLLEIAEKIEAKIIELGGKPAFPTNLSINEIAAHYTPSYNDETLAHGLLKVDLGVHIDGYLSDTAFSVDLEDNKENKKLIIASEQALENAIKIIKSSTTLNEIGEIIQSTIESYDASPIVNLSGHSIEQYDLHSGITIPNYPNNQKSPIGLGTRAIEPFATFGNGKVHDGSPSEIYILQDNRNVRNPFAKEVLDFIQEEYETLPFCSRWIIKKFQTRALFALKQLEDNNNLHRFPQLIESSKSKVSQTEQTLLITETETIVTTKE